MHLREERKIFTTMNLGISNQFKSNSRGQFFLRDEMIRFQVKPRVEERGL